MYNKTRGEKELPLHFWQSCTNCDEIFYNLFQFNFVKKGFSSFVSVRFTKYWTTSLRLFFCSGEGRMGKMSRALLRNDTNEGKKTKSEKRIMETFPFGSNDINFQFTLIYVQQNSSSSLSLSHGSWFFMLNGTLNPICDIWYTFHWIFDCCVFH